MDEARSGKTAAWLRAWEIIRRRWRPWLRALHRDTGYLAIGLTVIYACSGLAINHIADWDPNFEQIARKHDLGPLPKNEAEATRAVLQGLGIDEEPDQAYLTGDRLEIYVGERTLLADLTNGHVNDDYRKPRFFLRVANWLHYNRGKRAWTFIADGFAILLLYLAISGAFMIKGRMGLRRRGAVLIAVGIAVPVLYVTFAGGPGG